MKAFIKCCKTYIWIWLPLLTVAAVFCSPLMFLTEDDTMLNSVLADVAVPGSEYFNYSGLVLGWILRPLYLSCPALNWYAILSFACMTGSFSIFMWLLKKAEQESNREQKLLYALGMGFCFVLLAYNLLHLTFTNVAFLTTFSGGMLFLSQKPPYHKKNIFILGFSVLWFALGASFRGNAAKTSMVLLLVFVLIRLFETKVKLPLLFVAFAVGLFSWYSYLKTDYIPADETHPLYQYWLFDQTRRVTVDKTPISYEEHKELFEDIDISEEDLDFYYRWYFADYNVFHPDTFGKVMRKLAAQNTADGADIGRAIKAMFTSVINLAYMGLLLFIFLLGKKKNKLWLFFSCGCAGGMIFMLLVRARLLWRMQLAVMQLGLLLVLFTLLRGENHLPSVVFPFKKKPWLQSACIAMVCFLAFGIIMLRNNGLIEQQKAIQEDYAPIKTYLQTESENGKRFVSLAEHRIHFYYPEISFIQKREKPYFVNVGEADVFHTHWYHTLEQCGFSEFEDSIFRSLIDGEEIYAFTDRLSEMEDVALFLERHYAEQVNWEVEEQIGNWYIGSFERVK